jgi:hypothetical protein
MEMRRKACNATCYELIEAMEAAGECRQRPSVDGRGLHQLHDGPVPRRQLHELMPIKVQNLLTGLGWHKSGMPAWLAASSVRITFVFPGAAALFAFDFEGRQFDFISHHLFLS